MICFILIGVATVIIKDSYDSTSLKVTYSSFRYGVGVARYVQLLSIYFSASVTNMIEAMFRGTSRECSSSMFFFLILSFMVSLILMILLFARFFSYRRRLHSMHVFELSTSVGLHWLRWDYTVTNLYCPDCCRFVTLLELSSKVDLQSRTRKLLH